MVKKIVKYKVLNTDCNTLNIYVKPGEIQQIVLANSEDKLYYDNYFNIIEFGPYPQKTQSQTS
jgi:hypothetical protein